MALPKIELPIFELKIVSVEEPIKFRPFLVKEEKLLLMALQSSDDNEIMKTIKQVINNCLLSKIDIDKIPIFDIEYLFLNLRARSIGENVGAYFICRNEVGTKLLEDGTEEKVECENAMEVSINLLEIKPVVTDLPSKFYLTKDVGIQLEYPTLSSFKSIEQMIVSDDSKELFDMIYQCTDYVFDENGLYYAKETSSEEFNSFLESLTQEQFDKITGFFESIPTISQMVEHTCTKCGFEHKTLLEGLSDFFM